MKRLVLVGSILGTMAGFLAGCFFVVTTLLWIILHWCPAPWLLWTIGLGLALTMVAAMWRWWRMPAERRFRFSLRGMLIGVALLALWIGLIGVELLRGAREGAVLRELIRRGVEVQQYDFDDRRELVARVFGCDPLLNVRWICITRDEGLSALLEYADDLTDLESVSFEGAGMTDAGLARIEELNRFQKLWQGLFGSCNVTDAGLQRLADWRRLEMLSLYDCSKITDAGMAHIAGLPQLRELRLSAVPISDAGIARLRNMSGLHHLGLRQTKATEEAIRTSCEAMPNCLVTWEKALFPAVSQIRQIGIWSRQSPPRQLVTVTDRERIKAITEWLEEYGQRFYREDGRSQHRRDTTLSVRFEGSNRRLCEIHVGNGIYENYWRSSFSLEPAEEEQLRTLLGIDAAEWTTKWANRGLAQCAD